MQRADSAGMAGSPCLQEIERLGAADLPIGIRSGRSRSAERTRSESEAAPSMVRSATKARAKCEANRDGADKMVAFGSLSGSRCRAET